MAEKMIFVTVGASLPFDRLIEYIDNEIAPKLDIDIIAQIHDKARYIPKNMEYIKTVDRATYEKYIKKAEIIIAHAGIGVIMDCIKFKKKCIIVPRNPTKGEHIDSHQYEICKYLEKYSQVGIVYDLSDLFSLITKMLRTPPPNFDNFKKKLTQLKNNISHFLLDPSTQNKNIFIVSSSGGHFRQITEVFDVFPKERTIMITNATKTKINNIKMHVINSDLTDKFLPIRAFYTAFYLILKYRPKLIFTNGGGELAIPFAYLGKLFGCKIIFMETISRVESKSKAAQMIYPIADVFLVQWEKNLAKYGKKAKYWGSIL